LQLSAAPEISTQTMLQQFNYCTLLLLVQHCKQLKCCNISARAPHNIFSSYCIEIGYDDPYTKMDYLIMELFA